MKFYSEILDALFDTEAELIEAELQEKARKEKETAKKNEQKTKREEIVSLMKQASEKTEIYMKEYPEDDILSYLQQTLIKDALKEYSSELSDAIKARRTDNTITGTIEVSPDKEQEIKKIIDKFLGAPAPVSSSFQSRSEQKRVEAQKAAKAFKDFLDRMN